MTIRSTALVALIAPASLFACGEVAPDAATVQAPGEAVQALGVTAYDRFSEAPLGALLLDGDGEVSGEAVRTGEGASLAFELIDAGGQRQLHFPIALHRLNCYPRQVVAS